MTIVIDSDGLIGSLNSEDSHYLIASELVERLVALGNEFVYPATTLIESITLLQGRLNKPGLAVKLKDLIKEGSLSIEPVDEMVLKQAVLLINSRASKHHTLFDGVVAVIAKKYKADAIFSFDKFYKSKGFKLASEL